MAVVVQKYGGTSVDGRERLMQVAARVAALRREGHDVVVVVSAQGGTTDSLLKEARGLAAEPAQRELDMLMTAGERVSMSLLAIALNSLGCSAVSFTGSQVGIITDTRHTDARILEVRPHRVVSELRKGHVVVVGGFQGVSVEKEVTTLGRGGSDTTAIALAAALEAERCEILTDVDAVYTADPRLIRDARKIERISYEDMAELARFGATVLKEEAVRFAERSGIAISVGASTSRTTGTIVLDAAEVGERSIVGVGLLAEASIVELGDVSRPETLQRLASLGGAVRYVTAAAGTLLAAVDVSRLEAGERGASSGVEVALVCCVGQRACSGETVAEGTSAVRAAGIELSGGCSCGRTMVLAVPREAAEAALRAVHSMFFGTEACSGDPNASSPRI